jgi:uncharacterized membrane protein
MHDGGERMRGSPILYFVWGGITLASVVLGMAFFRIWRQVGDRFFALFSAAFWLLALERLILAIWMVPNEARSAVFLIRLVAFICILSAIVGKNR